MKVCYTAGPVKKLENCFSVSTNAVEIRIWFFDGRYSAYPRRF